MKIRKADFSEEAACKFLNPISGSLQEIEDLLAAQCQSFDPNVSVCVSYVTASQGKRMRPALVFYSAGACSDLRLKDRHEALLKAGLIIELIHIATLVHDDILDCATFRRNRLTAAAKWGPEISVLLGDCLFAHALKLAADFSFPFVCRLVSEATNTVCSGEILQTQRRFDLKLSRTEYMKMIEMKTGALFAVSCELGAFLAKGTAEAQKKLSNFGNFFGVAYQIYDDIVDLVGDEDQTGKSLGTDLQKGKLTLPLLLLLEQVQNGDHQVVSSLLLNEHGNTRRMLMDYVSEYKTVAQSAGIALEFTHLAMQQIKDLPANEGSTLLCGMNELLAEKLRSLAKSG